MDRSDHQDTSALKRNAPSLRLALLLSLLAFTAFAQSVPPAQQAALFSRILAYDRNLKARAGTKVAVAVLYRSDDAASRTASDEMLAAFAPLRQRTIQDLPFDAVSHAYSTPERLDQWLAGGEVDVIYVAPGLASSLGEILSVNARRKVVTLATQRADVQLGAAIGIVIKEGKPGILVNLSSAKSLGMDLDPKLLQLAEVIR